MLNARPGSAVGTVFLGDTKARTGNPFEIADLYLALALLADHVVVAGGLTPNSFGSLDWFYADGAGGSGLPSAFVRATDVGLTWSDPRLDTPQRMRLTADGTVLPDPATLSLLALGVVGLRAIRARRPSG